MLEIAVETLTDDELARLAAAIAEERAARARKIGRDDLDSLSRLWHEPLTDVCGAMSFFGWSRGPGKHARKHLGSAEQFVPRFFKNGRSRPEERYFARKIMVIALKHYLESIRVVATTSVTTKNMGSIIGAVHHQFPNYDAGGMLPVVYRQMVTIK